MTRITDGQAARTFSALTALLHAILPARLQRIIPRTFIGFAMINSTTFLIDLALLSFSVRVLGIHYPLAVSMNFAVATSIAFVLNKLLNFRAAGDVGRQSGKYALVVVSNYLIWILGFSSLLDAAGVPPEIARITAGVCEGIYIYLLSRLWVFGRPRGDARPA